MATIFETMHIRNLTNKWEQRKQNYTKQVKTDDRTPEQRQMDSMMEMLKRERDSTQKGNLMNSIDSKIKSGGTDNMKSAPGCYTGAHYIPAILRYLRFKKNYIYHLRSCPGIR